MKTIFSVMLKILALLRKGVNLHQKSFMTSTLVYKLDSLVIQLMSIIQIMYSKGVGVGVEPVRKTSAYSLTFQQSAWPLQPQTTTTPSSSSKQGQLTDVNNLLLGRLGSCGSPTMLQVQQHLNCKQPFELVWELTRHYQRTTYIVSIGNYSGCLPSYR